jgi:hypothetical protein
MRAKFVDQRLEEEKRHKINSIIQKILIELNEKGMIKIDCMGDIVSKKYKVGFIRPLLDASVGRDHTGYINIKKILNFIKNTDNINVNVINRKSKNYRVFYTGTIENSEGEVLEFTDVDNNMAVGIG